MPAPNTTYNLSSVYRALGFRDPRVMPNIEGGQLTPVIVLGTFATFAPQVIEARGFVNAGPFNILAGQWVGLLMLSTAPGGTILESLQGSSNVVTYNLAPSRPFSAAPVQPFTMGGQPLQNIFEVTGINVGAQPLGSALGGTNTPSLTYFADILQEVWVPPGWYFWANMNQNASAYQGWRFREIPESQGAA